MADAASIKTPRIPNHEVLRVIGRGAYGEIWMARNITGALRAVKVVHRSQFETERAFNREFEGMARFEPISRAHAGFVDILDVGRDEAGAFFYYAMELADDAGPGTSLEEYIPRTLATVLRQRGRLPVAECVDIGARVAGALEELHGCGLAHRDIKPANIIFVKGEPKIADIGLVAATGQRSFVGTEGYVPPEGPGTASADIYSLGKVLYEMCMGKDRLDFPEVNTDLSDFPDREDLLRLNPVLLKACASEPSRRYETAGALRDALLDAADARREVVRRSNRRVLVLLLVLLLVGSLAALVFGPKPVPVPKPQPSPTPLPTPSHELRHGKVRVTTEPESAMVLLGDRMKPSPAEFDDLDPGTYSLHVMLSGYDPVERSVEVKPGAMENLETISLQRQFGEIDLASEPSGAIFELRHADEPLLSGTAPAHLAGAPTGKYAALARLGAWQLREELEIGHEPQRHVFRFGNGSVKITSAPGGAEVLRSGSALGQTPLLIEEVEPGEVQLELRKLGFKNLAITGTVMPNQQLFLPARLEKNDAPVAGRWWTNSLGMKFAPVDHFLVSICETRVREYKAFAAANGLQVDPAMPDENPITRINWYDATAFCDWLTATELKAGKLRDGQRYRLPTDAEWSRAAGMPDEGFNTPEQRDGKIGGIYPWGKTWPPPPGAGNLADTSAHGRIPKVIEGYTDGFPQTCPCGMFPPNEFGLYDMAGNVWEWCLEDYKGGHKGWGVLRGGSWANAAKGELQSSYRNVVDRNDRDVIYGFRCVLVPEEEGGGL